jgi:hypothetical protein
MPIFAADVIAEVADELGPKLAMVGLAAAEGGSWPSLAGPLAWAAGKLTGSPLAPPVVDDDLATLADFSALCDLTRYRALIKIRSRWTKVNERVQSRSKDNSDLLDDLARQIQDLEKRYAPLLGSPADNFVISTPSSGLWSYRPGDLWWDGDEFERW